MVTNGWRDKEGLGGVKFCDSYSLRFGITAV